MRLAQDLPSRLCRLLFCLTLLIAWCAGPTGLAQAAGRSSVASGAREPTADDVRDLGRHLDKLFKAVEDSDRLLARDTFDPAAVVAAVGRNPEQLFLWVRDQTAWVPYRGALRGATGVLLDRVGNSLDRAVLLAELLRNAGQTVRLAQAELTNAQAGELAGKLSKVTPVSAPGAGQAIGMSWDQAVDEQARREGANAVQFRRDMEKLIAPMAKLSEELAQKVAEQVPALMEAVGDATAGAGPAADAEARRADAALEAMRDHWWVQRQDGTGWVDLDPTLTDARPGSRVVAAARMVNLNEPGRLPLDPGLWHEVTIRVVIEQWKDGKLSQAPVLSHALRPAEIVGKRVVFAHAPMDWPAALDLAAEANPGAKVRDLLLQQKGWVPVLTVDGRQITQAAFTSNGTIDSKPNLDAIANAGKAVSGAAQRAATLFDTLDAGAGPAQAKDDSGVLTAEYLEYEIRVPGGPTRTERRQVFDLIGPAARASASGPARAAMLPPPTVGERERLVRALSLGGTAEIMMSGARPSYDFVQHLLNQGLLASRGAIQKMVDSAAAGNEEAALQSSATLEPMPAAPHLFAVARWGWGRNADRLYIARPNVWAFRRTFAPGGEGAAGTAALARRIVFDIIANDVDVRGASGSEAFRMRVEQGVLDTNLESLLLRGTEAVHHNAADLFARSAAQGSRWSTLRNNADIGSTVAVSDDVKALVRQDLNSGFIAIAPPKPVRAQGGPATGWWRVDPMTGQTLGMIEAGGASFVEYANRVSFAVLVGGFTFYGCGGFAEGASTFKRVGCAVCAVIAGVLAYFAMVGAAAQEAGAQAPAVVQALSGSRGVAGAGGISMACNALSGGVS